MLKARVCLFIFQLLAQLLSIQVHVAVGEGLDSLGLHARGVTAERRRGGGCVITGPEITG